MLCVTSPWEEPLSKTEQVRVWAKFLANGTTHSARAGTLPYIIRRCEREKIPYILEALPGMGYHLSRGNDPGVTT